MRTQENKEKYKEQDHKHYIKYKRPKTKIGQAEAEIDQLKQQLAEKDCRIEELEGQFAYECECNKQLVELQKQLAEKDKTIAKLEEDNGYILFEDGYDENGKEVHRQVYRTYKQAFNSLVLEAHKLRQQIQEKEEEVKVAKQERDLNAISYSTVCKELRKALAIIKELKGVNNDRR